MKKYKNIIICIVAAVIIFGLSITAIFRDKDEFSDSERRALAFFPDFNIETVLSGNFMREFENYSQDQFPKRELFRKIEAFTVLNIMGKSDNRGLYTADDHISKMEYKINIPMIENSTQKFNAVYDKYLADNDNDTFLMIIPDKNHYLAKEGGYLKLDYDRIVEMMREKMDFAEFIDIEGLLSIDDFYMTDTHWKQENIRDIAEKAANEMGHTLTAEYKENILDVPFYGVYAGQIALGHEPDTIKYITNDMFENVTVTSFDTGMPVEKEVYDMEKAHGKDPYEIFLSGSDALLVIENPDASSDEELIVLRDSYASSFVPYLIEAYSKITLVDIRYIPSLMLDAFIEFGNQDVLFMYSTTMLNNSLAFK